MDDSLAGPTAVPGGGGELLHALRGKSRHRQRDPRTAAADLRHGGPHGARRGDPVDAEAVPGFRGDHRAEAVRGTGPFTDRRRRLEGRRGRGLDLADRERTLTPWTSNWAARSRS